jgi:hypothetical protein
LKDNFALLSQQCAPVLKYFMELDTGAAIEIMEKAEQEIMAEEEAAAAKKKAGSETASKSSKHQPASWRGQT